MPHDRRNNASDLNQHYGSGLVNIRPPLLHFLAGASVASLARTMVRHGGVSPRYFPQLLIIFASVLLRWPGCVIEKLRVAHRVRAVSFDPPPIFIVGHWRSGTTLLHNLMSQDPCFCFPTVLTALRPYDFYPNPFDIVTRAAILRVLPAVRPMDDMPLDPALPQEEELALATMGAPSFFNCFYFPRRMKERFAEEVLLTGTDRTALAAWREALTYFLAKLSALHPGCRLLLKNPAHSARIPHLRALFPGAKFIHIHRHPLAVFHSTRKLYRRMLRFSALQTYQPFDIDEHILHSYAELMNRLLDALAACPSGHVSTIAYDELVADPKGTVSRIYRELDLGDFDAANLPIDTYLAEHPHSVPFEPEIDDQTASRIAFHWDAVALRLGYPSLGTPR
jgi:hypothetical protein